MTDLVAVRILWERGFFGKGNLSRSEPSWQEREKRRKGLLATETSEEATRKRREERKEFKKERARKERLEIERQRQNETKPNPTELAGRDQASADPFTQNGYLEQDDSTRERAELVKSKAQVEPLPTTSNLLEPAGSSQLDKGYLNTSNHAEEAKLGKVKDPGEYSKQNGNAGNRTKSAKLDALTEPSPEVEPRDHITNQEHLQLTLEEAFFLSYGLGVLDIHSENKNTSLSSGSLFLLFRQLSYFPPRPSNALRMDDPFILSYVVYHHFRSLGWVIRPGVKFAVDYLLYNRGPVFAHAEFAVIILPSYSDPYYSLTIDPNHAHQERERKPWWWLHCVNRVQSQVRKSLLLVFVEVPPPQVGKDGGGAAGAEAWLCKDIGRFLKRYKVQEINVKRWIPNRSRD